MARDTRNHGVERDELDTDAPRRQHSVLVTGLALGVGIIGFLDEAVFHQILQWHTFFAIAYLLLGHRRARPYSERWSVPHCEHARAPLGRIPIVASTA